MLQLGRKDGFNYFFPGMHSVVVPYDDIYDFYFSGHTATCAILIYTLRSLMRHHPKSQLFKVMFWLWLSFKLVYIWLYMTSLRTHYLIDYTSGFCFGILSCIAAEKLS